MLVMFVRVITISNCYSILFDSVDHDNTLLIDSGLRKLWELVRRTVL